MVDPEVGKTVPYLRNTENVCVVTLLLITKTERMHLELSPKYEQGLNAIIDRLGIEASISNSFNAGGETIILSADREDVERIVALSEDDFKISEAGQERTHPADFSEIKKVIEEQLRDDA